MNCRDALSKLYDYIDGEIGHSERAEIAAHLTACRHCFDEFEAERLFRELVVARVPRPQARGEFKTFLLSRIAEESEVQTLYSPGRQNIVSFFRRYALAASLLLAIGVSAAWINAKAGPQRIPWRTLGGYHHEMIPVEEIGIETSDYSQARAFLAAQMNPGVATLLPGSPPPGMDLHECCVEPWKDSRLVHLEFDGGESGDLSLFVIPAKDFRLKNEPRIRVADRSYRSVKLGCCRAVCWEAEGGYVLVLLGDCHAENLLAHAEAWQGAQGAQFPKGNTASQGMFYSADSTPRR